MTAREAEQKLLRAGFALLRVKGSHYVYGKESRRVVMDEIFIPKSQDK